MVRDGIYYGLAFIVVAVLVGWLTVPALALIPLLLAAFFLWFFRDPEREVPAVEGAIVSPADGKVTEIATIEENGERRTRISIFLNVFDVHVNRSPVAGVISDVKYRKGKFGNAMGAISADENEQNVVTVQDGAGTIVFKQIAGLLARRIVFTKKVGDHVARGERVGLIKFGSRTDVIFAAEAEMKVGVGDRVKGGSSVLAMAQPRVVVPSTAPTGAKATPVADPGARQNVAEVR
jgi:phosphatidylserine decarboxylase